MCRKKKVLLNCGKPRVETISLFLFLYILYIPSCRFQEINSLRRKDWKRPSYFYFKVLTFCASFKCEFLIYEKTVELIQCIKILYNISLYTCIYYKENYSSFISNIFIHYPWIKKHKSTFFRSLNFNPTIQILRERNYYLSIFIRCFLLQWVYFVYFPHYQNYYSIENYFLLKKKDEINLIIIFINLIKSIKQELSSII